MKKNILLFLLAILISEVGSGEDKGAGRVFYSKDGTNKYVKSFKTSEGTATFELCKGGSDSAKESEIEFFVSPEVCAKLTLQDYEKLLDKISAAMSRSPKNNFEFSVELPADQDIPRAKDLTFKKLGTKGKVLVGNDLKITIFTEFEPVGNAFTQKHKVLGQKIWTDKSGFIQVKEK